MRHEAHAGHEHGHEHGEHDRTGHAGHEHGHGNGPHRSPAGASWSTAARATLHCLTGCAIGEVLGMVIGTALGWGNVPTMVLAIVLAFFFGYALTLRGILTSGVGLRTAVKVALAADTLSIAVMEIIDNGVIALWPGAMDAHLSDPLFWTVLAIALAAAFVITTPVNKWLIGRGKGHAVVHRYHH
ncbi:MULTISPECIES: DUF4396 domain-containing protein [unclassified Streptomyces]|uniref:DUF4396 domain-containing protein n=1 Tax=unclassified Streptomyces TaxID=2593676 RepID=UPI003D715FFA